MFRACDSLRIRIGLSLVTSVRTMGVSCPAALMLEFICERVCHAVSSQLQVLQAEE